MFAYVERNKMDFELLTCLLKFTEYSPDYLSALLHTLLRFFGQPLSKQLYITDNKEVLMVNCTIHNQQFFLICFISCPKIVNSVEVHGDGY